MPDIYIRQHNNILWLILNKHPHNMLTVGMLEQLVGALRRALHKSPSLIVITGTGDEAFCSGVELLAAEQRETFTPLTTMVVAAIRSLHDKQVPIVALVKGKALGAGCELAALCDTIIAREDALFHLPTPAESIFPDSLTVTLPAFIGREATEQLIQKAAAIDACKAAHLGLVQQVISTRRFTQDVEELLVLLSLSRQS